MQLVTQIAGAIAWVAILCALIILALRSRGAAAYLLLTSMAAWLVWAFWGSERHTQFLSSPTAARAHANYVALDLAHLAHVHRVLAATEAALTLWFAISLLIAVAHVSRTSVRPNNSSKPMPLRGTA